MTETTAFKSGNVWVNTHCTKCTYSYGHLHTGQAENSSANVIIDGMSSHVRNQRLGHEKDVLQPLKSDGTINKNFVKAHGTKSIQKEYKLTDAQIRENVERYG